MTRRKIEEHVEILKRISREKFNSMTEYTKQEIESWFVKYVNKNEDIDVRLKQLSIDIENWKINS
jgi:predicted nucleic acid-binding OB-fold protein